MNQLQEFRNKLLQNTIEWCVNNSEFYRKRFQDLHVGFRGLADLERLPVLFRAEAAEARDLHCCTEQPACVQYTTGTTGTFFQLFRSHREVAFIRDFYHEVLAKNHESNGTRPLCLALTSAYHGSPTPVPSYSYVISAGVYDRTQAIQAKHILEHAYGMPGVESRVSILIGGDILIKALTAFLISEGFDFGSCQMRTIVMTGGYSSVSCKRLLSDIWHCNVIDRYSTSEIFGGAVECGIGGPWTFDPEVIPEVVHPRTLKNIHSGFGVLVLTGLYPFMQMMPMIRYYTGDLVEIAGSAAPDAPDLLMRFVGRERRSVLDVSSAEVQPLILSTRLHEFLERLPDIMASPRFSDLGAGASLEFAGKLHYAIHVSAQEEKSVIEIQLGLRYQSWMYPERVAEIISRLRAHLYSVSPALREGILLGKYDLQIKPLHWSKVPSFNAK